MFHLHKCPFREPVDRIGFLVVELELLTLSQMQFHSDQEYNELAENVHAYHLQSFMIGKLLFWIAKHCSFLRYGQGLIFTVSVSSGNTLRIAGYAVSPATMMTPRGSAFFICATCLLSFLNSEQISSAVKSDHRGPVNATV